MTPRAVLRLTLGRTTTDADVDAVIAALPARVRARAHAGLRRAECGALRLGGGARS